MSSGQSISVFEHFRSLPDPRMERTKLHSLHDILVITICAVISGSDAWTDVEEFAIEREEWFRRFLKLPNGIPSHDTFGRVFAALDPVAFGACFVSWLAAVSKELVGKVVAVDGKTLRRSFDTASEKKAIHMVSAWASEARIVLGQVTTDAKSNEITAIPELLKTLELKGCIVTLDAMGCQRKIAEEIGAREADYVIGLKGNQGALRDDVKLFFEDQRTCGFKDTIHAYAEDTDKDHGRIETRRCWLVWEVAWLQARHDWPGLRSIVLLESERTVGEKTTTEQRFYISSLAATDAPRMAQVIRQHWGIENGLHWCLDMAFNEDQSRVRDGHAAENLAIVRHLALNLLKAETTCKRGIRLKRLKASWSDDYLVKVLTALEA